jgi:hypothetical protein
VARDIVEFPILVVVVGVDRDGEGAQQKEDSYDQFKHFIFSY